MALPTYLVPTFLVSMTAFMMTHHAGATSIVVASAGQVQLVHVPVVFVVAFQHRDQLDQVDQRVGGVGAAHNLLETQAGGLTAHSLGVFQRTVH